MTFEDILQGVKLPEYEIEIGVITANNKRQKVQVGITNAELMFIHENGSPLHHIPARPVLQMTLDYANANLYQDSIDKALYAFVSSGFDEKELEKELNKLCLKMQNYARKLIYDNNGALVDNAPSTIRRKGFNHPLFVTGQLARSITCRLIKV